MYEVTREAIIEIRPLRAGMDFKTEYFWNSMPVTMPRVNPPEVLVANIQLVQNQQWIVCESLEEVQQVFHEFNSNPEAQNLRWIAVKLLQSA